MINQVALPRDRRNVTILFVDIAGSTSLIQSSDAELAHELFAPALKLIIGEVERLSGNVAKVMGDGVMAIFGVPHTLEDHALRACHSALAIQARMHEYSQDLKSKHGVTFQVRAGLNSGTVLLSVRGEGVNEAYDAVGSPVHLAARIEAQTPPGSVGISRHTHLLVSSLFDCESLGAFKLKGFPEPEVIYRLLRVKEQHNRPLTRIPIATDSPMIGRETQSQRLQEMISRLNEGRGGVVLITGEAGAGKTRFVIEAKNAFSARFLWLEGQSSSYDQRISYWPFIEILTTWLVLPGHSDDEQNWLRLVENLEQLFDAEAGEVIPYVAAMLGMRVREPHDVKVRFIDTEVLGGQILRALWRLFEQLTLRQPIVLVIDDFHWADQSSVGLIEHLLDLSAEARLLICLTSRLEGDQARQVIESARRVVGLQFEEIELRPLVAEDSITLIQRLIGSTPESRYLRDQILYKAGGNPFFIEEVVRNLKASGVLTPDARDTRNWVVTAKQISVPDTIHDVVMARVDRLEARLKHLLSVGSVIGRNFLYTVLRAVAERVEDVDQTLGELEQRQFIEEALELPELMYRFRHALTQEAIYDSMLLEHRKKIHGRIADFLAEIFSGRTQRVASVLAFHYARAERPDKALHFLLEAADHALKAAADAEALQYYEDALKAYAKGATAPWEAWQEATIERRLAEVHLHRGNLAVSEMHFVRALNVCGDPVPQTRFGLLFALLWQLVIQVAHRLRGTKVQTECGVLSLQDDAHLRTYEPFIWLMLFIDQEKMVYLMLRALNLSEDRHWLEGMAKAASGVAAALNMIGLHGLAHIYHARALAWAGTSENLKTKCIVSVALGPHQAHTGQWDAALDTLRSACELARETGDMVSWASAEFYIGMLLVERGMFGEVLSRGAALAKQGREAAFDLAIRTGLTAQGKAMWRLGFASEAREMLLEALERAKSAGDHVQAAEAWGELGHCYCDTGDMETAAEQLSQARQLILQYKLKTPTIVPVLVGLAQAAIGRLEQDKMRGRMRPVRRCCSDAVSAGRRFYFGWSRALRLKGTFLWICGRHSEARRWWQQSLQAASVVAATYESALTRIEIGRRQGLMDELRGGEELLSKCRSIDQISDSKHNYSG